ncbi:MAG: HD domain-containing protein [Thermodesulfobacteriota bacterium]
MKCPGQDPRYWKFDAIFDSKCPHCGAAVEFFKDETRRKCHNCGEKVLNPRMDFGCAAHCKFAKQCFGEDLPPELIQQREELFKDRVAVAMKRYFKQDFKRIGHAGRVARYAEKLVFQEEADPAVVLSAAYLHDIGIKEAERKYQSTAFHYQHEEGPPIAREILTELGAEERLIEEVCDIVGHHHSPRPDETANFKVVYDADVITNLEEDQKKQAQSPVKILELIESRLLTQSGKELARTVLLEGAAGAAA